MNDELIRELEALAAESVAGPDPAFAAALEVRLRDLPAAPLAPRRSLPVPRALLMSGIAALAVAAAVALAMIVPSRSSDARVELAGATDAQVIRPDGSVGPARPGAVVPDGSIVRTGPLGQTATGDVSLGPNSGAVALDGHLRTVTSDPAGRSDRRSAGDSGAGRAIVLRLGAQRAGTGVQLRWSRFEGHGLYGYVVLRSTGGAIPVDGRNAIAFTGAATSTDRAAPAGATTYRVLAVDRQGRVLAMSGPVTVGRA